LDVGVEYVEFLPTPQKLSENPVNFCNYFVDILAHYNRIVIGLRFPRRRSIAYYSVLQMTFRNLSLEGILGSSCSIAILELVYEVYAEEALG